MLATISIPVKRLRSKLNLVQLGIVISTMSIKHMKSFKLAIVTLAYPTSNGSVLRETIP